MVLDLNEYRKQLLLGDMEELTEEETRRFAYWAAVHDVPIDRETDFVYMVLKHPLLTSEELEQIASQPHPWNDYLTPEVVEAFLGHPSATSRVIAKLATVVGARNEPAREALRKHPLGSALLVLTPACSTLEYLMQEASRLAAVPGGAEVFSTFCRDEQLELCWMSDCDVQRLVERSVLVCRTD